MRIFGAFLILLTAGVLWLFPLTESVYDFRTDVREDTFNVNTGVGITTVNVTLVKEIYNNDTQTVSFSSNLSSDRPLFSSYNITTRALEVSTLTDNKTRALSVEYDIDALRATPAVQVLVDRIGWIWLLMLIAFPAAAILAIFIGRA